MLSNETLEKLIVPIARRQEDINNYIVGLIAKRLKDIGEVNASDVAKLNQLMNFGGDMRKIEKALAQATSMNVREIRNILYTAADSMYGDAKALYEFRGLPFVPLEENRALSALVEAISAETVEAFENLSNTTAFTMNVGSVKRPLDIRETYKRVVDEAIQAVTYFVDDALVASVSQIKILHGTGNGILRTLIRQYLSTIPAVVDYRDEHPQFGGAGITIVELV